MGRLTILLGIVLVTLIAESTCRGITRGPLNIISGPRIILPTYRPPVRRGRPILRTIREVREQEPLWLYEDKNIDRAPSAGDHPVLPPIVDDVKLDPNRRTARSVDSPSAKRGGGSSRGSSGGRDTGETHPGYNRRNARAAMIDPMYDPLFRRIPRPRPHFPGPRVPRPDLRDLRKPIYARTVRDVSNVELEPSERVARSVDSPSAKRGGGSSRGSGNSRDTGATHPGYNRRNTREARRKFTFDPLKPRPRPPGPTRVPLPKIRPFPAHPRSTRDVSIADVVRKPTHRDVIIPNWNPHARVNPWQRIRGNGRRPRSAEEFDEFADEEMGTIEHLE